MLKSWLGVLVAVVPAAGSIVAGFSELPIVVRLGVLALVVAVVTGQAIDALKKTVLVLLECQLASKKTQPITV